MPTAEILAPLADTLELLLADHDTPSLAVGVAHRDDDVDLVVRPLRHHPADELIGFVAPADWTAFGIVARGRTLHWPGADLTPSGVGAPPPGTEVRIAYVVDRAGRALTRMADLEGRRHEMSERTMGLVPDICRRVLGLPTDPPVESPLRYWAARWLSDVLDIVDLLGSGAAWPAVAACHPAVGAVAEIEPDLAAVAGDHLIVAAEALVTAQPWAELHRRWSDPESGGHGGLTPAEVRWTDGGMLARWCLGLLPDLDELADAAFALLPDEAAREVGHALEAWGLLDAPPPNRTAAYDHPS